ncbi:hypothetical protein EYR40_002523 [Pleurotus pulmonarius]|nr:hypothetical protein EYR40_002523 [Pleurotus pulmonarius]
MFNKQANAIVLFFTIALFATLAVATPTMVARTGGGGSSCPTTDIKCCEHVGTYTEVENYLDPDIKLGLIPALLGLLGLTVGAVLDVVLGVTCSSISVGSSCSATTVCCENVVFNGLINVGCTAIDIL